MCSGKKFFVTRNRFLSESVLLKRYPAIIGEPFECCNKVESFMKLYPAKDVSMRLAAKAIIVIFKDVKTRSFFLVKWAKANESSRLWSQGQAFLSSSVKETESKNFCF